MEDVFLAVADDLALETEKLNSTETNDPGLDLTPGRILPFWLQVRVLFRKRLTVFRRFWWPYLYALALPIIITVCLRPLLNDYGMPGCADSFTPISYGFPVSYRALGDCNVTPYLCRDALVIGPQSANDSLWNIVEQQYIEVANIDPSYYYTFPTVVNSRDAFVQSVLGGLTDEDRDMNGGVFMDSGREVPLLSYVVSSHSTQGGHTVNLWSQMHSGLEIVANIGSFAREDAVRPRLKSTALKSKKRKRKKKREQEISSANLPTKQTKRHLPAQVSNTSSSWPSYRLSTQRLSSSIRPLRRLARYGPSSTPTESVEGLCGLRMASSTRHSSSSRLSSSLLL